MPSMHALDDTQSPAGSAAGLRKTGAAAPAKRPPAASAPAAVQAPAPAPRGPVQRASRSTELSRAGKRKSVRFAIPSEGARLPAAKLIKAAVLQPVYGCCHRCEHTAAQPKVDQDHHYVIRAMLPACQAGSLATLLQPTRQSRAADEEASTLPPVQGDQT